MNPYELNAPSVARVGFGCAAIGRPGTSEAQAQATIETAWDRGIRLFDTAPMYGSGRSEVRLGKALAGIPRDQYVLSSKVGRIVDDPGPDGAGTGWHFDFSADGIRRSLEASLERLRLDRIDVLLIHDADNHWEQAIGDAVPVLREWREQGVVRAIGAGMTRTPLLARFAREADLDVILVAGRYSLLSQDALDELFPRALERGIAIMVAAMLHGGLIEGVPDPQLHYRPMTPDELERRDRIADICRRHGVPSAAAAIQFPLAHPAVTGLLTGPFAPEQVAQNLGWLSTPIPAGVWTDLRAAGLLDARTPVPEGTAS